ncbi:MAG: epoxide hydrolase-like predicted phosphatase [Glaciecola sp.]|jgi:epoxide hydrolase-like predicted phosphatase
MMRKALLVDYGGVLTGSLGHVFRDAEVAAGVPKGELVKVLLEAYGQPEGDGFVHRFERGEMEAAEFEGHLRTELAARGHQVSEEPLMSRVFGGLGPDRDNGMWDLVRSARSQGVGTGLLSNSWGTAGYPLTLLHECFEDLVISGEVGLRKPDPAIYLLAAERLGVGVVDCIFVDDLDSNVEAAQAVGMAGVVHRGDVIATAEAIEAFLGLSLR